jgi:hypothetical protein
MLTFKVEVTGRWPTGKWVMTVGPAHGRGASSVWHGLNGEGLRRSRDEATQ